MQLLGFKFGGGGPPGPNQQDSGIVQEKKPYVVPEDRAIGRPHMMGWLNLLGEDEELMGGKEEKEEKFEADNWVAVEE